MKVYEIWSAGYLATGMEGIPSEPILIGRKQANTFEEACDECCQNLDPKKWGEYDRTHKTIWGLKLYPTYLEALEHTPKRN